MADAEPPAGTSRFRAVEPAQERARLRRFKWVLGTPYVVQGTSNLTEVPILYFIKFTLGMGDAGGQLFDSLRQVGWLVKPVWGLISDRVPVFGYRRKSWFVLMALGAVAFWASAAVLALLGVRIPLVFLVVFNLAFATYAFVDVVCDALMVEEGRRRARVAAFVNFQWTALAVSNAGAVLLGSWMQAQVEAGVIEPWLVFAVTGLPPLATAWIGLRNIDEAPVNPEERPRLRPATWPRRALGALGTGLGRLPRAPAALNAFRKRNTVIWTLVVFLFFWKFSPSVGFVERSYLIDERGFDPLSFGLILGVGSVSFLFSILAYRWVVRRFPNVRWDGVLYAMVALGVVAFPLSFFLYLDPGHPWWNAVEWVALPAWLDPLPGWNRYEWFRLAVQTVLGFATIPAFLVPLTLAGQTVSLAYAGVSYAFLMAFTNVTNVLEGVIGAGLYDLMRSPTMEWAVDAFARSWLDIAGTADERTLILQMFVYVGLAFTILTVPFVMMLRRELDRRGVSIELGEGEE